MMSSEVKDSPCRFCGKAPQRLRTKPERYYDDPCGKVRIRCVTPQCPLNSIEFRPEQWNAPSPQPAPEGGASCPFCGAIPRACDHYFESIPPTPSRVEPPCTCFAPPTEQHATYCPREGMDYDPSSEGCKDLALPTGKVPKDSPLDAVPSISPEQDVVRQFKDYTFNNCRHFNRDRNYDYCAGCVAKFMRTLAAPLPSPDLSRLAAECAVAIDNESRKPICSPLVPSLERQRAIATIITQVSTDYPMTYRAGVEAAEAIAIEEAKAQANRTSDITVDQGFLVATRIARLISELVNPRVTDYRAGESVTYTRHPMPCCHYNYGTDHRCEDDQGCLACDICKAAGETDQGEGGTNLAGETTEIERQES